MASSDVIGIAICIMLLVVVSYVVVGAIMTTTTTVSNAQKDMDTQNAARLDTAIQISDVYFWGTSYPYILHFHVQNTGNEMIRNFDTMDVYLVTSGNAPVHYTFNASLINPGDGLGIGDDANNRTWNYAEIVPLDALHPNMLDSNETMSIRISNYNSPPANYQVIVTTPNGISASYTK